VILGNNHFTQANVLTEHLLLLLPCEVLSNWAAARPRKIVERGVVSVFVINVRLVQSFSVSVDYAIGNPDTISGHANEALH
jgi:hypothetical protein